MKSLTVRQPWAFSIIHLRKDIENRSRRFHYRGPLAIHAGLYHPPVQHGDVQDAFDFMRDTVGIIAFEKMVRDATPPGTNAWDALPRGGFIGIVDVVDCVESSDSPWFFGPYGLVLANPRPVKFHPFKGRLGLFDIPDDLLEVIA